MNKTALQRSAGIASSSASVAPSLSCKNANAFWRSAQPSRHCPTAPLLPQPQRQGLVVAQAQRLVTQAVDDFPEVYETLQQRCATTGFLPKQDTMTLIQSMRSTEHALRVLQLLADMLKVRIAMSADTGSDWHVRKRWYTRFCEVALFKLKQPQLLFELMRNRQAFAISKYFCADLIVELGRLDATDDAVLQKLAELNMAQAEPGCKGVRRSYMELLQLAKRRKDEELETSMKAALTKVTTGAPAAAEASAQAPPPPPPPPPAAVAAAAAPAKESGTDAAPEPAMASA